MKKAPKTIKPTVDTELLYVQAENAFLKMQALPAAIQAECQARLKREQGALQSQLQKVLTDLRLATGASATSLYNPATRQFQEPKSAQKG